MPFKTASGQLSADVADGGTFTVSYPSRGGSEHGIADEGDFFNAMQHAIIIGSGNVLHFPDDVDLTFGTSSITVTNKSGSTWPAGSTFRLQLEGQGKEVYMDTGHRGTQRRIHRMVRADAMLSNLGAPDVADADGICASQSITAGTAATIAGALASGGAVVLDVPRNVVAAWTGTSVMTVSGYDEYGQAMSEASASGTSLTGKKAFKRVTAVNVSANVTLATVGTGDVLGLPVFLPSAGCVLKEMEDGAAAAAGTLVAGLRAAGGSATTSADVRGTYDPNSAADGGKVFHLLVSLPNPGYIGPAQA